MNIINKTDFSDQFLKKMMKWIWKQILVTEVHLKDKFILSDYLSEAKFTNCSGAGRGRAWYHRILIRIGSESRYPVPEWYYHNSKVEARPDRICGLVGITAHELSHIFDHINKQGVKKYDENRAVWNSNDVVKKFQSNHDSLLTDWNRARKKVNRPVLDKQQEKLNHILISLKRWQRRMKLAQTKIRKLKNKVHYYEVRQAAIKEQESMMIVH